jgi:F0F1-type ATP synthase assembly protein I
MANIISTSAAKVTNNVVGGIAGGAIIWWASKKYMGVDKMWLRAGLTLVGVVAGAYAQSKIKAKSSAPKAGDTKTK